MKTIGTPAYRHIGTFLFALLLLSCGKKKEVLSYGTTVYDGDTVQEELYRDHDSVFKTYHVGTPPGRLFIVKRAATIDEFSDSTYSETIYFTEGIQTRRYVHRKAEGTWNVFYASGKKKSASTMKNGVLQEYRSWREDGSLLQESQRQSDGRMVRTEYFLNGKVSMHSEMDSTGTGSSVIYFMEGDTAEAGSLRNGRKTGIWKFYDEKRKVLRDTLFGL